MLEAILRGPDAVFGHIEAGRHAFSPGGCFDGLTPIVRHPKRLSILYLSNRHVAVDTIVAIVDTPLDYDDVLKPEPVANL